MEKKLVKRTFVDILCLIFYSLFTISFSYIFVNCLFRQVLTYKHLHSWIYLLLGIFTLLLWMLLYHLIKKIFSKLSMKQVYVIFGLTFLLSIVIMVALALILEVPLGWDFEVVYSQARAYVLDGDRTHMTYGLEYFQWFPNNIFIFLIEVIIFKIGDFFGIHNFLSIGVSFNGLVIFLSILFMVLYCYQRWGKEKAYFSLLLSFFFFPLYLYLPIFYSDTMSVMFGPLLLFLSTLFKDDQQRKNILLLVVISIVLFIGMKIKMTIFFFFFSFLAIFIIQKKYKRCFAFIGIFLLCYVGCNQAFQSFVVERKSFQFTVNDYGKIPVTHWMMMGIEDPKVDYTGHMIHGGYYGDDYLITQSYDTGKESIPRHIKEIKRRIHGYGLIGYANYLTNKAVNAWGDGSYFSHIALSFNHHNTKGIQNHFCARSGDIIYYIELGIQMAFLFILCVSGIYCIRKNDREAIGEHIAIFILFLFLLIWENRSRYLYNYIPIFIIVITCYIDKLNIMRHEKNRRVNNEKSKLSSD